MPDFKLNWVDSWQVGWKDTGRLSSAGLPSEGLLMLIGSDSVDSVGVSTRPTQEKWYLLGDGTGYLSGSLTGSEQVVSKEGTAAVVVSAGQIDIGVGTLWSFELDNGSKYEIPTKTGTKNAVMFDISGNGRHLLLVGFSLDNAIVSSLTLGSDWLNQVGWNYPDIMQYYIDNNADLTFDGFENGATRTIADFSDGLTGIVISDENSSGSTVDVSESIFATSGKSIRFAVPGKTPYSAPVLLVPFQDDPVDFTAVEDITINIYIPGSLVGVPGELSPNYFGNMVSDCMSVLITSDADAYGFTNLQIATLHKVHTVKRFRPGWNVIKLKPADFNYTAGSPDLTSIKKIKVKIQGNSNAGTDYEIYIDNISVTTKNKPTLVFSFDDGLSSPYVETLAWQAANPSIDTLPITLYVVPAFVGDSGYLTLEQLHSAYDSGWDICVHGWDHTLWDAYATQALLEGDLSKTVKWLLDNGFDRGAIHSASPGGGEGQKTTSTLSFEQVTSALENCGIKTARWTKANASDSYVPINPRENHIITGFGLESPYLMYGAGAMNIGLITTSGNIDNVKATIDHLISYGGIGHLWGHHVFTSGSVGYITPSEWAMVLDYAYAQQQAGLLDIMSMSQAYDKLTAEAYNVSNYQGRVKYNLTIVSGSDAGDWVVALPQAPELIELFGLSSVYFDTSGAPKQIAFATLMEQNGPLTFGSTAREVWAVYSEDQTDPKLTKILDYMGN